MEAVLKPPPPFLFDNGVNNVTSGNLCIAWQNWRKAFTVYFDACELNKKTEPVKINIFLHIIGPRCQEVYGQFTDKGSTLEQVLQHFDRFFQPKKNITVERHRFFTRDQKETESTEQYVFELNKMAARCEFKDLCSDLVRDRLICGIKDSGLRERLLREPDLKLNKALEICRLAELSCIQASNIKKEMVMHCVHEVTQKCNDLESAERSVCWVQSARCRCGAGAAPAVRAAAAAAASGTRGARDRRRRGRGRGRGQGRYSAPSVTNNGVHNPPAQRVCSKCGSSHELYKCPAYGVQCNKCNRYNHYAKMCNSKVFAIEGDSTDQVIFHVTSDKDWFAKLSINNGSIDFKLDTGADVNIIPKSYLSKIGISESELTETSLKLRGYSGDTIKVVGKCNLKAIYKGNTYICKFIIADVDSPPILGKNSCEELNLIKRVMSVASSKHQILNEFADLFDGIGCLPGEYEIQLDPKVRPVVHSPRKLPVALKESVKTKLAEMVDQGIIAKVEGPTDWVSSMTLAKKPNGDFRICLDPQDLNKAIRREHFRLPTLEEITANLSGAVYFSTLDAKQGFWQVKLKQECTDLCTFNTAFGRYKFLRLPYGVTSASEVFHKKLFEHFDDIEGVCQFIDDLLIYGKTKEEHNARLRKVLQRCREINIKLNKQKCKIGLTEIKYLGHKISQSGISPDDAHTSALKNMPQPANVKDLERFLGLVTYVGSFIPNLSEKTHPLRELLKKEVEWYWGDEQRKCFEKIKQALVSPPVLQYYSLNKPVTLSVDASKNGLGACLLQNGLPVCYASKSLTKTEQAYAQIEKELYACVFACEKFYAYIYGRTDIIIETDHKPLVSIIKKPISSAPPRLQRMLLRLQPYTFTLVYKPGKYLYVADTLSRACAPNARESEPEPRDHLEAQAQVCAIVWGSWGLPAFMCDIYIAMDVTSSTSSIFNLVAISVDRYIAVTQPIKYAKHKNNRRVWFTIVLVWLISAAIGGPIVLGLNDTPDRNFDECLFNSQNYVIYSSLGSFYIPCIMMMFLYYSIFKALRNRAKKQRAAKKPPVSGDPATGATQAVVIENVVQTRRLAETALHDDKPTNTGSGSNEEEHEDSLERRSLEADANECHVIPNDKSTEFMLATVTEESVKTPKKLKSPAKVQDPNGNNDSGYAPSNLEDTIREHATPPGSPALKDATVLQNMACVENGAKSWSKNGKTARIEQDSRNASLQLHTTTEDLTASHLDLRDGSSSKKERKASAATARFTIYKANKASKKKREKSSAKKERKATKTLAIVLGVFLFCWAPFFTCNVLDAICGKFGLDYSPGVTVFILTTWLGYINSFLNPVIYTIFNPEFRKAFRKILRCGT